MTTLLLILCEIMLYQICGIVRSITDLDFSRDITHLNWHMPHIEGLTLLLTFFHYKYDYMKEKFTKYVYDCGSNSHILP